MGSSERTSPVTAAEAPFLGWDEEVLAAAVYRPLIQSTAVADAAAHLREAIVLCLLPAGSRLPIEPDLAERLGVGVVTMRTALALLREEGFIVTTRGRKGGSWVADADAVVEASARATVFAGEELRSTIDLLIGLETQSFGLAATRATAEERAVIRALGAAPRDGFSTIEWQTYANVFHLRIANAAHSPMLAAAVRSARARVQQLRNAGAGRIVFCVQSRPYLGPVADRIADGDAVEARRLCHEFLTACWNCTLTVIDCRATRDLHDVEPVPGALGALRYARDADASRRADLRVVDAEGQGRR